MSYTNRDIASKANFWIRKWVKIGIWTSKWNWESIIIRLDVKMKPGYIMYNIDIQMEDDNWN